MSTKRQTTFNTRAQAAATLAQSEEFYSWLKNAVVSDLKAGNSSCIFKSYDVRLKKEDLPLLQPLFMRLKEELPELDHIRYSFGNQGFVIDTKPNNLLNSALSALSAFGPITQGVKGHKQKPSL